MGNEVEAKYRVDGFTAVRKRLNELGAEFLGTVRQTDTFFDDAAGSLQGAGCGLRLRREKILRRGTGATLSGAMITFKGPVAKNRKVKIREEIETCVDSPDATVAILAACGFRAAVTIEKRRSSYRLGRARIELDQLPLLGTVGKFVEIEGVSERNVETVRKKLGIDGEHIPESYLALTLKGRV
ncbi:MAG: class IV adenylate cyclase [Phycisphaerae bacterium]|nr:class IV adenylate cyclase [Phycisphaerae bacterium]